MSKVRTIFSLSILHEYYTDGRCRDIDIRPTPSCEKLLAGHRISFLPEENGFTLNFSGEAPELPPLANLFFSLHLANPDFLNFTSLDQKKGFVQYFFQSKPDVVEQKQVLLRGKLFDFLPVVTGDKPVTVTISTDGQVVYSRTSKGDISRFSFQPDLRHLASGLYLISVLQGTKEIQKQEVYIDDALVEENTLGIFHIRSLAPSGLNTASFSFKSSRDIWKFYFISEKDNDDILVLKDAVVASGDNRYSAIDFNFCERPVEERIQGNRTYLFETGSIDKNDTFQPQLIPAYEEGKIGLSLTRYEPPGSGKGSSKDDQYCFCIDRKYWDKKSRRHIVPKGQKGHCNIKLGPRIVTVMTQLPKPVLTQKKKEIYIYI